MLSKRSNVNGVACQLINAGYQPLPANIYSND